MKTKTFTIILIVAAILIVHAIALFIFFKAHKSSQAAAETAKVPTAVVPELPKVEEPAPKKPVNPLFGTPFSYKNTINGDRIASLPGTKSATSGMLVDLGTRQVLWAKNPQKPCPIASMTKMMTMLVIMEYLDKNKDITMDTPVPVTVAAAKIGGSQVYLDTKETFPLKELLKAVEIKSANDAAYLVAEFFGKGDVYSFVQSMNKKSKEMNLTGTKFFNPHGLPGDTSAQDNVSSPEAMALIAEQLLEYPQVVEWSSTWKCPFGENRSKPMEITNHNHLVNGCPGVDGMKTGFIQRSGFCTTVTCKRADRRLVAVVTGFPNRKERDAFVKKLLDWGYRQSADGSSLSAEGGAEAEAAPAAPAEKKSAKNEATAKKNGKETKKKTTTKKAAAKSEE